jgi:serine/threonine protein kinase
MIESEIAILSSVSHPNIIQLEEVFDFPAEKYLIMEYVQVMSVYLVQCVYARMRRY